MVAIINLALRGYEGVLEGSWKNSIPIESQSENTLPELPAGMEFCTSVEDVPVSKNVFEESCEVALPNNKVVLKIGQRNIITNWIHKFL